MFRAIGFAALFPLVLVVWWEDVPEWAVLAAWGLGFALVLFGEIVRARSGPHS